MNKPTAAFCFLVSRLDYIPRYGRVYHLNPSLRTKTMKWEWQSNGRWGFYLLLDMNLFFAYSRYLSAKEHKNDATS